MLLEAIVLFAGFKFLSGSPHAASGAQLVVEVQATEDGQTVPATHGRPRQVEVLIVEFRAPNKQSGRTFLYDVAIFAMAKAEFAEQVKQTIKAREALIKDRIRTIIAQSDPEKLGGGSEPGLETLRRQVKYQLDEIIGEGMIDEVLVPRCIPFRTDF
jgi:flagellar basal body-associated protein FliL